MCTVTPHMILFRTTDNEAEKRVNMVKKWVVLANAYAEKGLVGKVKDLVVEKQNDLDRRKQALQERLKNM